MVRYARGDKRMLHDIMLLRAGKILLGNRYDAKKARTVLKELRAGDFIPMNSLPGKELPGNRPTYFFGKFLYFIVRMAAPEVMVETGVAHGVSLVRCLAWPTATVVKLKLSLFRQGL